jgi:hypothetical protein
MPRVCTACGHDERDALNRAVVRGAPLRRIAESHGLSESALRRHAASCVPKSLASAENARVAASAEGTLGRHKTSGLGSVGFPGFPIGVHVIVTADADDAISRDSSRLEHRRAINPPVTGPHSTRRWR